MSSFFKNTSASAVSTSSVVGLGEVQLLNAALRNEVLDPLRKIVLAQEKVKSVAYQVNAEELARVSMGCQKIEKLVYSLLVSSLKPDAAVDQPGMSSISRP